MIRRAATLLVTATALASCAAGPARPHDIYDRLLTARADPGKVVASELAFARAAQERGQWTAFADFATRDAVMFVPQTTKAQAFLKGRANPAQAVTWQPHEVWSSCDGSLAVTKGAWQKSDGSSGYFTTVWQRQQDGAYKWVMDQGDVLAAPLAAPEFVRTDVASCDVLPPAAGTTDSAGARTIGFASADRTLRVGVRVDPWCGRITTLELSRGLPRADDKPDTPRGMVAVMTSSVAPPQTSEGAVPPRACEAQ